MSVSHARRAIALLAAVATNRCTITPFVVSTDVGADGSADVASDSVVPLDAFQRPDVPGPDVVDNGLDGADAPDAQVLPVRLIAPLAGSIANSDAVTFHWTGDAVALEFSPTRDFMGSPISIPVSSGQTSQRVTTLMRESLWYWRAVQTTNHSSVTPAWPIYVQPSCPTPSGHIPDYDGDGHADLVVLDTNAPSSFALYHGTDTTPYFSAPLPLVAPAGTMLSTLAAAGDFDGNGYMDIVATSNSGVVIYPGDTHSPMSPRIVLRAPAGVTGLGAIIAAVGDVNGDGYADVAASAEVNSTTQVWVLAGGPLRVATTVIAHLMGGPSTTFAEQIAGGDFNGDGVSDLVVTERTSTLSAAFRLFLGPIAEGSAGTLVDLAQADRAGCPLAIATADLDGDHLDDVVLGDLCAGSFGELLVTFGSHGDPAMAPQITVGFPGPVGDFGATVTCIGDVDRNGHMDLAIGSPPGSMANGTVYLVGGEAIGRPPPFNFMAQPETTITNASTRTIQFGPFMGSLAGSMGTHSSLFGVAQIDTGIASVALYDPTLTAGANVPPLATIRPGNANAGALIFASTF